MGLFSRKKKQEEARPLENAQQKPVKENYTLTARSIFEQNPAGILFLLPIMVEIPELPWRNGEILARDNQIEITQLTADTIVFRVNGGNPDIMPVNFGMRGYDPESGRLIWHDLNATFYANVAVRIQLLKELGIYETVKAARETDGGHTDFQLDTTLYGKIPEEERERAIRQAKHVYVFRYAASSFLSYLPEQMVAIAGYSCGDNWEQGNPKVATKYYRLSPNLTVESLKLPLNCGSGQCGSKFCPMAVATYIAALKQCGKLEEAQGKRQVPPQEEVSRPSSAFASELEKLIHK